jgi:simple sugar transport system permease protein
MSRPRIAGERRTGKRLRGQGALILLTHPTSRVALAIVLISIVFTSLTNKYLTFDNFISVISRVSELGLLTIGIIFLMVSGEFDLSISAVYAACGFLFCQLANWGVFSPVALLITLVVAAVVGALNGIITLWGRIPSFIATLGMSMIIRGSILGITNGASIYYNGDEVIPRVLTSVLVYNFRPSHIWFLLATVVFGFILRRTVYGNWITATGGNLTAARLMGVRTNRVKMINFIISSTMAGFVGVIVLNRFKVIAPDFGVGIELDAIAAAVIGGTLLTGGFGTILGGVLGASLVSLITNGLVLSGAPPYWYRAFIGVILIGAAIINLRKRDLSRRE